MSTCTDFTLPYTCKYQPSSNRVPCTAKKTSAHCNFHSDTNRIFNFEEPDLIFNFPRYDISNERQERKEKKLTKIQKLILLTQSDDPEVAKEAEVKLNNLRAKNIAKKKARKERKRKESFQTQ